MSNPHFVTQLFEQRLCEYTGAPFAVAVNSCTMALTLAVAWHVRTTEHYYDISIPKRTYVSVPQAIIHAGASVTFTDEEWLGYYQLKPLPVFDCARWFSWRMYDADPPYRSDDGYRGNMLCVSFHASKILGIEQGGAILHDNAEADAWFRRARFDGRAEGVAPKDDKGIIMGWHCYMNPSTAAQGILKLHSLPKHNPPLPNDDYPDLSELEVFK